MNKYPLNIILFRSKYNHKILFANSFSDYNKIINIFIKLEELDEITINELLNKFNFTKDKKTNYLISNKGIDVTNFFDKMVIGNLYIEITQIEF